jgi:tetratricopeptide (TPR) repeat protein
MNEDRRPRPSRHRIVPLALVLLAAGVLAAPRAHAADEPWEQAVERAVRRQDREMKSAQARKTSLADLVRRYDQLVLNDSSALNHYLLGRIRYYDGDADGAVPSLRRALQQDPRFYFADLALAIVYLDKQRVEEAEYHILQLRRKKPDHLQGLKLEASLRLSQRDYPAAHALIRQVLEQDRADPGVRRALAACLIGLKEWKRAASTLRLLVEQNPRETELRRSLAECYLQLEDFKSAAEELNLLRRALPDDPLVLWQHGLTLYKLGQKEEALVELERLDGLRPGVLHVLDLMQVIQGELGRREARIATMTRMLDALKDKPDERAQLAQAIEALRGGGAAASEDPGWQRNPLTELLERCVHPDAGIRSDALHEYFESDIPFVDPVIYRRYDPQVEPDPSCRIWVFRILGRFRTGDVREEEVVRDVARYAGLGLEDPVQRVRTVAAEEVGNIGTPSGLLYLLPHVSALPLASLPDAPEELAALENEFNAARLALCKLTGRRDVPVGEPNWVRGEGMAAARDAWLAWFDTPEGIARRLAALEDIRAVKGVDPRWQLRYVLVDVIRDAPGPVARESYRVMRDAIRALGPKAAQDPWWPTFPQVEDAGLEGDGLRALRERVRAWWKGLPRPGASR